MSLDVYLTTDSPPTQRRDGSGIYIRRNGQTVEISREWDQHFPGQEPVVLTAEYNVDCTVYTANITHNLGKMAAAANIYQAMWRPEEIGATRAKDIAPLLQAGLEKLRSDPDAFRIHNPSNGWGDYDGLVRFTAAYLEACERFPEAAIRISR